MTRYLAMIVTGTRSGWTVLPWIIRGRAGSDICEPVLI